MKLYKAEAVVLRARDYGEGDKLLTLYSREYGKIRAAAHGVSKPSSRKRGAVQPFTLARFLLRRGRELDSVSQCEGLEMFLPLREDLERIAYASYIAELVDAVTPEGEPNEPLFLLLLDALRLMPEGDPELLARAFEIRTTAFSGYRPVLESCVNCMGDAAGRIFFSPALGGVLCPGCRAADVEAVPCGKAVAEILKLMLRWRPSRLRQLKVDPAIKRELREVMHQYLKFHLDKDLKSSSFLNRFVLKKYE
ncbi:MAG TPA: DNA repair protein RecO [Bacillota bacterium]|nr:DNA repair protein RecO [Bacillota bacterium]